MADEGDLTVESSPYACLLTRAANEDDVATVLTDWANKDGMCYKFSFPVYKETFDGGTVRTDEARLVKFQVVVVDKLGISEPFNYFLVESGSREALFQKVNCIDYQVRFCVYDWISKSSSDS